MKTKLLTFGLLFSFLTLSVSAQKKQTSGKNDFMKEMIFSQFKSIFQPDEVVNANTRKDYVYPWNKTLKMDKTALSNSLDTVAKNFLCEKSNDEINIKSKFPSNFQVERELFSVDILDYNLKNGKGAPIVLQTNMNFLNFGNEFSSSFVNDNEGNTETKNENVITLNKPVRLKTDAEQIAGSITVEAKFITGYDYIKITKSDIGQVVDFKSQKFKILSINKGIAIIKILEGDEKFDYLVTSSNNQPYNGGSNKTTMAQEDFDFFSNNSKFTKEEFDPYYEKNRERLLSKDLKRDIIIIKSDGEIANLYLYKATDILSKRVELNLKL